MIFKSDWHIHSEHSCDGASMKMEDLVTGVKTAGIDKFGVSDHIHTPYNYPDIENSRKAFDENRTEGFHFGVEISCVSRWELETIAKGAKGDLTYGIREGGPANGPLAVGADGEFLGKYDVEYTIGGVHWPMYAGHKAKDLIRDYHRQNMFMAAHDLVDVVAHPWWYYGPCEDGWTTDFEMIPHAMHVEFAACCIENGKMVEVNLGAMLLSANYSDKFKSQYLDYLEMLKESGVKFSIGSDCHLSQYDFDISEASKMLQQRGFTFEDFHDPV